MTWRPLQEPLDHLKGPSNHSGWDTTIFPRLAQEPVSQAYSPLGAVFWFCWPGVPAAGD